MITTTRSWSIRRCRWRCHWRGRWVVVGGVCGLLRRLWLSERSPRCRTLEATTRFFSIFSSWIPTRPSSRSTSVIFVALHPRYLGSFVCITYSPSHLPSFIRAWLSFISFFVKLYSNFCVLLIRGVLFSPSWFRVSFPMLFIRYSERSFSSFSILPWFMFLSLVRSVTITATTTTTTTTSS